MQGQPERTPDLLKMKDLQLFALAVYNQLILLQDTSSIMGSGHLYHDVQRNVTLCQSILGTRILSGLNRGGDEKRKLQQRVREFQKLMLQNDEE